MLMGGGTPAAVCPSFSLGLGPVWSDGCYTVILKVLNDSADSLDSDRCGLILWLGLSRLAHLLVELVLLPSWPQSSASQNGNLQTMALFAIGFMAAESFRDVLKFPRNICISQLNPH